MIDWATLSDDQWLQVDEFVLGKDGKNSNAPVRYGRVSWYQFVKDGDAPMGKRHGSKALWQYGDIKRWVNATSPKTGAAIAAEIDPESVLSKTSSFDVALQLLHTPNVVSITLTKAKLGGFTMTIERLKGKPLKVWVNKAP
jgi:hypothetical protein